MDKLDLIFLKFKTDFFSLLFFEHGYLINYLSYRNETGVLFVCTSLSYRGNRVSIFLFRTKA